MIKKIIGFWVVGSFLLGILFLAGSMWGLFGAEWLAGKKGDKIYNLLTPLSQDAVLSTSVTCAVVSVPTKYEIEQYHKPETNDKVEREPTVTDSLLGLIPGLRPETNDEDSQITSDEIYRNIQDRMIKLGSTAWIRLVDRERMEDVLKEHAFQTSSLWASSENIAEVGRALNAQYLIYITLDGHVEFLNTTTFQKVICRDNKDIDNAATVLRASIEVENNLDGTWICNGIMTNGVKYDESKLQFVSPFSSGHILKEEKPPRKLRLETVPKTVSIQGDTVQIDGVDGEFRYASTSPTIYSGKAWVGLDGSAKEKAEIEQQIQEARNQGYVVVDYPLEDELTNSLIGSVIINSPSLSVHGKIYKQGDRMAIELGSDGKKKAKYYYLVFTKF